MKHSKRKIALIALVAIVLTLLAQATVAYISNTEKATNVVTSGEISFEVHETDLAADTVVLPGDVVEKEVSIKNICTHPFYLRIKLTYDVDDVTLTAADCFAPNINTDDWAEYEGWYYYKEIVDPDETTTSLFTQVEIVGDKVDNGYIGKKLTMSVLAQAVQSEHNPITDNNTYTASGWPAE